MNLFWMGIAHLEHLKKKNLMKQVEHDSHITRQLTHAAQIIYKWAFHSRRVTYGKMDDRDIELSITTLQHQESYINAFHDTLYTSQFRAPTIQTGFTWCLKHPELK
jgi:cation transport regulator ChaB